MTLSIRYILDTDHISFLEHNHPLVTARFLAVPSQERSVTIITIEEQLRGRLAIIQRASIQAEIIRGYEKLSERVQFYNTIQVLPFDTTAAVVFEALRSQRIRVGTQDLRIAAIALSLGVTLVTRNTRDFSLVPGLRIADWSQPLP